MESYENEEKQSNCQCNTSHLEEGIKRWELSLGIYPVTRLSRVTSRTIQLANQEHLAGLLGIAGRQLIEIDTATNRLTAIVKTIPFNLMLTGVHGAV